MNLHELSVELSKSAKPINIRAQTVLTVLAALGDKLRAVPKREAKEIVKTITGTLRSTIQ